MTPRSRWPTGPGAARSVSRSGEDADAPCPTAPAPELVNVVDFGVPSPAFSLAGHGVRDYSQARVACCRARQRRLPRAAGSGTPSLSGYGVTQPMEPTGKSLPVEVAVKPNVTLPSGGMVRL
ncbi:hypothetical protein GCM10010393_41980 [Streptomyces gobitricini]|uniref:Uncharacterized protein n=1 Tax=Streptomyces gobitricini TaxID=68211 RepID=A0ABP5ZWI7_9ACTN